MRSTELSECQCADGTGEYLQRTQCSIQAGGNEWAYRKGLHVPCEPCDRIQRKYCLRSAASQIKADSRRRSRFHLLANALQCGRDALDCKQAGRGNVLLVQTRSNLIQSAVIDQAAYRLAIGTELRVSAAIGIQVAKAGRGC